MNESSFPYQGGIVYQLTFMIQAPKKATITATQLTVS